MYTILYCHVACYLQIKSWPKRNLTKLIGHFSAPQALQIMHIFKLYTYCHSPTSIQPKKLIFGMQPYFDPTRIDMEDNLNILKIEDNLIFF